ncbi:MAG: conjugal transfer protein TrbI [Pseudomonadota bacterium]|nr:conjugal transfer protein TrbI [Pseudomonadota bacterium]
MAADNGSPGGLGGRPKPKVVRLNRLAQVVALALPLAAVVAWGLSLEDPQEQAQAAAAQTAVATPQANAHRWWHDLPDGYPAPEPVVVYQPAPAPEPEPETQPQQVAETAAAPVDVAQAPELPPQPAPALYDTSPAFPGQPGNDAAAQRRQALEEARKSALMVAGFGQQGASAGGFTQVSNQQGENLPVEAGYFPEAGTDDPNLQGAKRQFLDDARQADEADYVPAVVKQPLSPYEVKAGWIIPAVLITGINSDLPGQLIAQVREHVFDTATGRFLLIPQGAKLVGTYDSQVAYGQSRLLVAWRRIIFPDGSSLNIKGQPGADLAGLAGFKDKVDRHYLRLFGSAILLSVVGAGAQLSQPEESRRDGGDGVSVREQIAAAVGAQIAAVSGRLLDRNLDVQPTLEVRPGYRFNILVTADLVLPSPYQE